MSLKKFDFETFVDKNSGKIIVALFELVLVGVLILSYVM